MDSADSGNSSVASATTILDAAQTRLSTACHERRWRRCVGPDVAVDDLDGIAFAGSDVVEHCLAGSDGVALPANSQFAHAYGERMGPGNRRPRRRLHNHSGTEPGAVPAMALMAEQSCLVMAAEHSYVTIGIVRAAAVRMTKTVARDRLAVRALQVDPLSEVASPGRGPACRRLLPAPGRLVPRLVSQDGGG